MSATAALKYLEPTATFFQDPDPYSSYSNSDSCIGVISGIHEAVTEVKSGWTPFARELSVAALNQAAWSAKQFGTPSIQDNDQASDLLYRWADEVEALPI
jgi:hypothetical protein